MSACGQATQGTITPFTGFDPEADCKKLYSAMKGLGTDEKAIISVICYRSNAQRQVLKVRYKSMYGKDLDDELSSELSGDFSKVIQGLMVPSGEYDAYSIRNAVKGAGTDENALIEVLASRTNAEIHELKLAYKKLYGKEMEKAVASDTSGDFRNILVSLMVGNRDPDALVDFSRVQRDATDLYNAGEKRLGTDEDVFNQIFATRSYKHLCAVYEEYKVVSNGSTIEHAIKKEMSGDTESTFLAIVDVSRDKLSYFTSRLFKSMKGIGTHDSSLIRLMISRSEKDLVEVKECFKKTYKKALYSFIKDDTSGDYRTALLAICRD